MIKYKVKKRNSQILVYAKFTPDEKMNASEVDILEKVFIRGLMKLKTKTKKALVFSCGNTIPLADFVKMGVSKHDFFLIAEQINELTRKININGLSTDRVVWDFKYIFVNVHTKEINLIYLPFTGSGITVDMLNVLTDLARLSKHIELQDKIFLENFKAFIAGLDEYNADTVERYILKEDRSAVNTIKRNTSINRKNDSSDINIPTGKQIQEWDSAGLRNVSYYDEATNLLEEDIDYSEYEFEGTSLLTEEDTDYSEYEFEGTSLLTEEDTDYSEDEFEGTSLLTEEDTDYSEDEFEGTSLLTEEDTDYSEDEFEGTSLLTEEDTDYSEDEFEGTSLLTEEDTDYSEDEFEGTSLLTEEDTDYSEDEFEGTSLLTEEDTDHSEDEFEGTSLLTEDEYEETGLLDESDISGAFAVYPELRRILTDEIISVDKPVFRIGKEKSYVDYFVSSNNTVSRSHADIITKDGRYFIKDLNSRNKTYINDVAIPPHVEHEIFNNDIVRLSNEEFIFFV